MKKEAILYPLVQKEDPTLRKKAGLVAVEEITGTKIQGIISSMKKTLTKESDGVAIAAPQVGISLQIFVVSPRVHRDGLSEDKKEKATSLVFVNPKIIKQSKRSPWLIEGCLSVRWLYGKVKRSEKVTIEAYNDKGKKIIRGASGLLAQVFQHEIDHLNGILFIDKAKNIENMPPEGTKGDKE